MSSGIFISVCAASVLVPEEGGVWNFNLGSTEFHSKELGRIIDPFQEGHGSLCVRAFGTNSSLDLSRLLQISSAW